ncbi:pimeloyl-ACP methyl ester carboxylesterase [Litorivivens lipolytica]|uniref:Pimeloyl-ACP methyl ester carboxylesterase n=1 Tax=Litorivivens lipolytica TaxID=1524264 RepID=A0A7W4W6K3_9GAMM|nr:alpha/beta hydrolase [Litorivivens lipolytica]MBB3048270.1 pimeloyl-ACP methyl ester carboxylesterase [Litorivivens lipolytica]
MSTIEISSATIRVGLLDMAYREAGEGPLVICLHGFPDTAHSFDGLLPVLAKAGFRAVAPFMRGYYPTAVPADGDYAVTTLAADVLGLIQALGEDEAVLIGHDWGGFTAYAAANLAPEKVRQLVVIAVPHMGASRNSFAQLRRSWYVWTFQLPWLPERLVSKRNFHFIDRLYRSWSPNWPESEFQLAPLKAALAAPGGLRAALGYYRRMIRGASRDVYDVLSKTTSVPALWFVGEADGSIGPEVFVDTAKACSGPFELVSLPDVGHFVHREAPQVFQQKVLQFLASTPSE